MKLLTPGLPLELGFVARPHGVRGELKVKLHHENGTTLFEVGKVLLGLSGADPVEHELSSVRRAGKHVLVGLVGVESRDAAESWRGARVLVDRRWLPELEPGEYYLADLVGCTVTGPSGTLGVVEAVQTHPTLDSLVIRTPDGRALEQPLIDAWLERVDTAARLVVLSSEDGLID